MRLKHEATHHSVESCGKHARVATQNLPYMLIVLIVSPSDWNKVKSAIDERVYQAVGHSEKKYASLQVLTELSKQAEKGKKKT